MDSDPKKLGPLLRRMAELNAEADSLSQEIDEHLSHRATSSWQQPEENDESATG